MDLSEKYPHKGSFPEGFCTLGFPSSSREDYPPIGNQQDGISSNRQPVSGRVSGIQQFTVYISQLAWTDSGAETGERPSVGT